MKRTKAHRCLSIGIIMALVLVLLTGCGASQATPEPAAGDEAYVSAYLDTSYEAALSVSGQLALGILQLEETGNAVSADQAGALLPLWQALRGGGLQSQEEMSAVLKQIEATMTGEQLEAIAGMRLTLDDLRAWAESQGLGLEGGEGLGGPGRGGQLSPEARATRQAQFGGQGPDPEAIATMRGRFGNMSDEQRQALRATAEAGGATFGGRGGMGGFLAGVGQARVLFGPLIELLTARAAG
jgi:hypothetical protein